MDQIKRKLLAHVREKDIHPFEMPFTTPRNTSKSLFSFFVIFVLHYLNKTRDKLGPTTWFI